MNRTRFLAIPLALAMATAIPAAALASDHRHSQDRHRDRDARRAAENRAVAAATVDATAAIAAARNAGYRTIIEVEWDSGLWEVEALNEAGERAKLYVDARSGNVVIRQR